jgi:hypothetical protein
MPAPGPSWWPWPLDSLSSDELDRVEIRSPLPAGARDVYLPGRGLGDDSGRTVEGAVGWHLILRQLRPRAGTNQINFCPTGGYARDRLQG